MNMFVTLLCSTRFCPLTLLFDFLFRLTKSKQSGFDDDAPVRPVNGAATADAAIGFDNSLYYEIRNPDTVEGIPNGKTFDY